MLGLTRLVDAAAQIVIDLARDQPLLEQRLIAAHLAARGRLTQELRLQRRGVVGILVAQRLDGGSGSAASREERILRASSAISAAKGRMQAPPGEAD